MSMTLLVLLFVFASSSEIVVHEWGTYTSMQGPNGVPMPGLHHGEEKLPDFVHSRASEQEFLNTLTRGIVPPPLTSTTPKDCYFCEVMDWKPVAFTPSAVTQKLETPVIYFYTKSKIETNVSVGVFFPEGIIMETYPRPETNLPRVGDVKSTSRGYAQWQVTVFPFGISLPVPAVSDDNIWAPSRRVSSNYLENSKGEKERHIFYRGLGRFSGPVAVKSDMKKIYVENLSEERIPAAWVLRSDGSGSGVVRSLGPILPKSIVSTDIDSGLILSENSLEVLNSYIPTASVMLRAELEKAGLFEREAQAMVDTWKNSYLRSSGSRVLYIAPQSYPDRLLPMKLHPHPSGVKRVLVGRVELLLQSEVQVLAEATNQLILQNSTNEKYLSHIKGLGRFAEAKIRYVISEELSPVSDVDNARAEQWILDNLTY